MIQFKDIDLSFDDKQIFSCFNAEIEQGKSICFSGVSGRGKSTLLKIIMGYIIPESGSVYVDGNQLNSNTISKIRDSIVWIPQNINLPVNNGSELIKLMDLDQNTDAIGNNLIKLGLTKDILDKGFDKISGGQKQRVIIAICISIDKPVIIMDEPTSSLDDKSITMLIDMIKGLRGKTVVSASHNAEWINSADKVIEL
jgi:ABC-type bacteriocin/lantibiotic exporter with double-glycine peptidase domain